MTNIQTNQVEALSDAELDNVAGGFNLALFKIQAHNLAQDVRHPIANHSMFGGVTKAIVKNVLGFFD